MIKDGGNENSGHDAPTVSKPGGEGEGEELRFIPHLPERDQQKRSEDDIDQ